MQSIAQKKRAERLLQWKQDGVKAASEYEAKELATRLLTAKLRAERLVREVISSKYKKSVTVKTKTIGLRLSPQTGGALLTRL